MDKSARVLRGAEQQGESVNGGPGEKQNMLATLRDVRPEVPKIEIASHAAVDVPAAVRKRPLLTLGVVVICLLAGAQYVLRHVAREYHAEAAVYVSPTYFKNLQQDREQLQISYPTLVNQQILTIRRFDILREALDRLQKQGIQWRGPAESEEAAVDRLAGLLDIKYIQDSYEILIGLNGPTPERLAPILNTVTQTYLEKEKQDDMSDRSSRLSALTAEQGTVAVALQQKLDEQAQFAQKLTALNLDKASVADDALLNGARQALEEAHRKRVEAETQFAILQGAGSKDSSGKNLLSTLAEEEATNDVNTRPIINGLLQSTVDLQKSMVGLTPEHPLRKAAEKEIGKIQDQIKQMQKGLTDDASVRLLAKTRADVDRSRLLESELDQEVASYTAKVQSVAKQVQMAQVVSDEVDRLRKQQNAINSQIDALNMPGDTSGYLRIFSAARTPLAPNKSSSKKLLFVVLGVAIFLGIGAAVAMDLIDQRILSPSEVKRAVGFLPVGIVLEPTPGTMVFAEEQFRRLVNGIQRGLSAQNAKSVVLTPIHHARTPCTLISDIGRVLVSRGLKTAIVDANPLRATDERVRTSGLTDRVTPVDHPFHSNGIPSDDPRLPARIEMDASQEVSASPLISRISGLLDELEQAYDVVLIDAPPLGLSADTEFLATIGDITLLVVEGGEATRRELIRGANLLGRIGAPSVGVVMSQVRMSNAGGALNRDFKRFCSVYWSAVPDSSQA
jgi:uncharacterized protein involved in exopolysaccharide biosynthesis